MLELKNLAFAYRHKPVLRAVDLSLATGDLLCLLGPNGAGKSTLFRCILGLLRNYTGEILLRGTEIRRLRGTELARSVAFIPQAHQPVFDYSVLDVVLMGATGGRGLFGNPQPEDERYAREQLVALGIAALAERSYARLSGGERQLVLVARALAQRARILIMDEPTANLDYGNQVRVMERIATLAAQGYAIMLSTHNPEHAFLWSNRTAVLLEGRIQAEGPPAEVLTEGVLKKLYGVPVKLFAVGGAAYAGYRACVPAPADLAVSR